MAKKESYFKRIKKPVSSLEEAKPIIKETVIYFLVSLALFIVFGVLAGVIQSLCTLFTILALVCFIPTAYFGIMLYAAKCTTKRFKNLHCVCSAELKKEDMIDWKEVSRNWSNSNSSNRAESKLYVTVRITCKCSKCGKIKTFNEKLCSGKISVTDYSTRDTIVSTQSLIDDYFAGLIHK